MCDPVPWCRRSEIQSIKELIAGNDGIAEPRLGAVDQILHTQVASSKHLSGVSRKSLERITDETGHQLLSVGEIHTITRKAATVGMRLYILISSLTRS